MTQEQRRSVIDVVREALPNPATQILFDLLMDGARPTPVAAHEPAVVSPELRSSVQLKRTRKARMPRTRYPWNGEVVACIADDDIDAANLILWDNGYMVGNNRAVCSFVSVHKVLIEQFKALPYGQPRMDFLKREYGYERHNLPINGTVKR